MLVTDGVVVGVESPSRSPFPTHLPPVSNRELLEVATPWQEEGISRPCPHARCRPARIVLGAAIVARREIERVSQRSRVDRSARRVPFRSSSRSSRSPRPFESTDQRGTRHSSACVGIHALERRLERSQRGAIVTQRLQTRGHATRRTTTHGHHRCTPSRPSAPQRRPRPRPGTRLADPESSRCRGAQRLHGVQPLEEARSHPNDFVVLGDRVPLALGVRRTDPSDDLVAVSTGSC